MNKQAIKEAIYRELYRQGIEFATVIITPYAQNASFGIGITQYRSDQGDPDRFCVESHVTPPPDPPFAAQIRELDQELGELIDLGLIERKDCGYALTGK